MMNPSARLVRRWPAGSFVAVCTLGCILGHALLPVVARAQVAAMVAALPPTRVTLDRDHNVLTIELPPVDLPASTADKEAMVVPPTYQAVIPASGAIYQVHIDVLDSAGNVLPKEFLHHVNLTDPSRRDLFVPTSLHILAASKETPAVTIPRWLMGLPLEGGSHLLVLTMLANPTTTSYHGVHVRVNLGYTSADHMAPLFHVFPWVMDAMFPLGKEPHGSKAFDLAPGRTIREWEASPAIAGTIVGCGGHVHDYATALEFSDATTGRVIWHASVLSDSTGRVVSLPVARFYRWYRLGVHIVPNHKYRIKVTYDNPTGHVISDGGMGAVAGLFIPDRGTTWPRVDPGNTIYKKDFEDTMAANDDMEGMEMHGSH
jgi:hypothetical protein